MSPRRSSTLVGAELGEVALGLGEHAGRVVDADHARHAAGEPGGDEPGAGADVGDGHGLVELGGRGETLDDGLVVVDEAHLVPVRGDAVEEGGDPLGRQVAS